MHEWMGEFIRKSENRGDKIVRVKLYSRNKFYRFTLHLFGVGVRCDAYIIF